MVKGFALRAYRVCRVCRACRAYTQGLSGWALSFGLPVWGFRGVGCTAVPKLAAFEDAQKRCAIVETSRVVLFVIETYDKARQCTEEISSSNVELSRTQHPRLADSICQLKHVFFF